MGKRDQRTLVKKAAKVTAVVLACFFALASLGSPAQWLIIPFFLAGFIWSWLHTREQSAQRSRLVHQAFFGAIAEPDLTRIYGLTQSEADALMEDPVRLARFADQLLELAREGGEADLVELATLALHRVGSQKRDVVPVDSSPRLHAS